MTIEDYEPFYCDEMDGIIYGIRQDWHYCPYCGKSLTRDLQQALSAKPLEKHVAPHDVRRPW